MNTTLALAEITEGQLLGYLAALAISGILLIIVAATGFGTSGGGRVLNGIIGIAMLGYASYVWIANPDTIWVFWYVLIVPVLLLVQVFRSKFGKPQTSE